MRRPLLNAPSIISRSSNVRPKTQNAKIYNITSALKIEGARKVHLRVHVYFTSVVVCCCAGNESRDDRIQTGRTPSQLLADVTQTGSVDAHVFT